jgi:threonine/homoserine/homoserine lactone efflux protein
MFGIHDFGIFLASGVLLNLTPGQDTFYILGRSISQGRSAGVVSVLGIASGAIIHIGVSAWRGSARSSAISFVPIRPLRTF